MENISEHSSVTDAYDARLRYHQTIPPLDVRRSIYHSNKANHRPQLNLKWGIISCGKCSNDFVQALKMLTPDHSVAAVAARSDRAKADAFASKHSIPAAYGSYQELCDDPAVDIVYVASLHPDHRRDAEMALRAGKHVLVEKPMCMTASDAAALYDLGKEKSLFVGEGMWTMFFPAVEWTRRELLEKKVSSAALGPCRAIRIDFSIDGDDVGPYPQDSIYNSELGGGTLWTMGPYIVAAAMLPFGRQPDIVSAAGILPKEEGVGELAAGATFIFQGGTSSASDATAADPRKSDAIASALVGLLGESSELTEYVLEGGRITLHSPAHCPTGVTRHAKGGGRIASNNNNSTTALFFPLPNEIPAIDASGGFNHPNSMGFVYEAEAVRRIMALGGRTFPQWTPEESVACIRTIERIREQIVRVHEN